MDMARSIHKGVIHIITIKKNYFAAKSSVER